ncbi:MAG: DUF3048 domain-containing protein [Ruminococcaceae bacterium]|nr:DUF3048 domain-containing protein [Oscillospiraceae bacterium]
MKKVLSVLLVLCLVLSVCSCGKKAEVKPKEEQKKAEATQPIAQLEPDEFYKKITSSKSRPLAIMIDNDSYESRPQWGLENAYMIYEIMVEGASTRMMALFLDSDAEKIGPVRSSRHYFLDYVMENDAIYAHCGFSPQAANDIKALGINNVNELYTNNGKNFYRDSSDGKRAPHNLYASISEVLKYAKDNAKYRLETEKERVLSYAKQDADLEGDDATEIKLPYNSAYSVSYKYNADEKVYDRYVNSKEHTSLSTKKALTAKNIIIYKVKNYSIDEVGRQNLENIGSGEGYYISNGKCVEIKWEKTARNSKTVYKTADGNVLEVNPGNTFIQIMPLTSEITIQ